MEASGRREELDRSTRVLVAYYSATGHVHALAKAVARGAEAEGADVRLRPVEELAPEMLHLLADDPRRSGVDDPGGTRVGEPDAETVAVAVAQGRRLARVARVIGAAQEQGRLDVRRGILTQ
jgi:hypothetical protein